MDKQRRTLRGRTKRTDELPADKRTTRSSPGRTRSPQGRTRSSPGRTRSSPGRRASPARTTTRQSPVRRSSRPRSTLSSAIPLLNTVVIAPSPVKEVKEPKPSPKSKSAKTSITPPAVAAASIIARKGTPSSILSRVPILKTPITTTSSVHSSTSTTTTQETIEIRSSVSGNIDSDIAKLGDYMRRSVSKTIADVVARARARENSHTPTTNTEAESRFSRSVSRSVYDDDNYSKAEFSDNDDRDGGAGVEDFEEDDHYKSFDASHLQRESSLSCRKLEVPREFGGWFGVTLIMLLVPCLVYYLQWSCSRAACVWKPLNLTALWDATYLTQRVFKSDAVSAYLALNFAIFLLSAVLFGRRVRLPSEPRNSVEYKFNALPIALVLTIAAGIAVYLKYPVADFVLRNYLRFCIYGFLNAIVVALWSYVRSDVLQQKALLATQANVYGKTGNFLIDFAQGRQLNPKWLGFIEFKQVFYRIAMIFTLLYAEAFLYKAIKLPSAWHGGAIGMEAGTSAAVLYNVPLTYVQQIQFNGAALLTAAMLLIYIADAIIFEHHLASSFELQGEGFGCLLLLRYAATPYLLSAVARYFCERRIVITCKYAVYVAVILLFIGLLLKRFSSAVKYKYRINPTNPIFYGIETIHTFQGRRLLLGALWGRVRQPNYAGDILALLALALPLHWQFAWPPAVCLLLCIVLLLHRAVRVSARNQARYHSSWVRYCSMVHNYIVPKIF